LVVQYGDASGAISFQAKTINNSVGCVSPDSVKTLPNGMTVWLGRDAFFAWKDGEIGRVSGDIDHSVLRRIHKHARRSACAAIGTTAGIYRCWVPVDGSNVNNLGLEFDGVGWSEIDFIDAHCVCTTRDDREYMIAIGEVACTVNEVKKTSVWLLDHENQSLSSWDPSPRQSIIETTWLRNPRSARRGSARRISLWLQETGGTLESVEVMRDWRMHPTLNTGAGNEPELYLSEDPPLVWGTAVYDADYVSSYGKDTITQHFTSRRPFWTRIDVHVPSCEVFKIRLSHTGDFEFIGITYEDRDLDAGGAKRGGGAR